MSMMIRLNPSPEGAGEGGGSGAGAGAPTLFQAAGQKAEAPPTVESLTLPRSEVERLYGAARTIESLQALQAESERKTAEAEAVAAAAKGQNEQLQKLLADRDATASKIRDAWLGEAKDKVVASALAGKPWVSEDATKHAARLLSDDLEAVLGDDGRPIVRDRRTGRPATDTINERLASTEFAYFLKAQAQGGSGATMPTSAPTSSGATGLHQFFGGENAAPRTVLGGGLGLR